MNEPSASADVLRLLATVAQLPAERHDGFASALDLPLPASIDEWKIAHTETFVHQCPPHASFVVGKDGQIGGEAADRVADFRRMLGVEAPHGQADGLPNLLADYAELVGQAGDDARAQHARAAMLWEHVLSWIVPYLNSVVRSAPVPYDRWAVLTRDVLYLEAERVALPTDQLPLHLRAAPPGAELLSAESADAAVRMLLTPIASGVVFTRADLAHAATHLQVHCMHGTRSATATYLLEQDGPGTLAWLAQAARDQAHARRSEHQHLGHIAAFWSQRAAATADALATMAGQSAE